MKYPFSKSQKGVANRTKGRALKMFLGAAPPDPHSFALSVRIGAPPPNLKNAPTGLGRYYILTWLACESLRDLFPAGAINVLPSVCHSYPLRVPDFPYMSLVDPG